MEAVFGFVCLMIASVGPTGFIPGIFAGRIGKGGGTAGSLVGVALQVLCMREADGLAYQALLIVGTFWLGMLVVEPGEMFFLGKRGPQLNHRGELVYHDFNFTCVDEVFGMLIAGLPLYLFPALTLGDRVGLLILAFLLFRYFDAKKTGWVKDAENLPGALGVMADDGVAGVFAAVGVILFRLMGRMC